MKHPHPLRQLLHLLRLLLPKFSLRQLLLRLPLPLDARLRLLLPQRQHRHLPHLHQNLRPRKTASYPRIAPPHLKTAWKNGSSKRGRR